MYIMEDINRGPLDVPDGDGKHNKYGGYWGHAEQWHPEYKGHSYFRIRDMENGNVITNISHSIGLAFFAAFMDYDHVMLWVAATPNGRGENKALPRPYGPPPYSQ
jgi:hypothetical protein